MTVLETDDDTTFDIPHDQLPPKANQGDTLLELPEDKVGGDLEL